jgi:lysophospholipase L1-like esterase
MVAAVAAVVALALVVNGRNGAPPPGPTAGPTAGATASTSPVVSARSALLPLKPGDRVLFLGDSLTELGGLSRDWSSEPFEGPGWISVLSRTAAANVPELRLQFINRGVSGDVVPDLLARLQPDVLDADPDVVVVYIGINDVWGAQTGAGTPAPDYAGGLTRLVRSLLDAGIRVLVCTPTVIGEMAPGDNQLDDVLERYTRVTAQVAHDLDVPVCDLSAVFRTWLMKRNTGNLASGLLTTDGVHLTDVGNRLVARTVAKALDLD